MRKPGMFRTWSRAVPPFLSGIAVWVILALLFALLGCAGHGPPLYLLWTEPEPGPRVAVVAHKLDLTGAAFRHSGWYRIGDELVATPVHLLVTGDRRACLVSGRHIVEVQVRNRYHCTDGWRAWRGR